MEINESELRKSVDVITKINEYCFAVDKQPGVTAEEKRLAHEILTMINEGLKKEKEDKQ